MQEIAKQKRKSNILLLERKFKNTLCGFLLGVSWKRSDLGAWIGNCGKLTFAECMAGVSLLSRDGKRVIARFFSEKNVKTPCQSS